MKIAFIRPGMFGVQSADAMQPLVFSIIKGLTPKEVEICFYDELVEPIPMNLNVDAVAMTVDTFSARRAYQLADAFRKQEVKILMGGFHPTMMPEECLEHADSVAIGEAEDTWGHMLEDLTRGNLKNRYCSSNNCDLSQVEYDYSVFEGKRYNRIGLVQFGRGCRFCCDFCSIHAFYKDNIRFRDVAAVVDGIQNIKKKYIFFIDDNIFADPEKARELFTALIPLGKKWLCQISMDAARDLELLRLMKRAGCMLLLIGFESLDRENLKMMNKRANLLNDDYEEIIQNIYDSGLMIYGTFVIGYDHDSEKGVMEALGFAVEHGLAMANFNPLIPMPGTPLYERMKEENRLLHHQWWTDEQYRYGDAMLVPRCMTGDQLRESCRKARFEFHTYKNIFKRLFRRFRVALRNRRNQMKGKELGISMNDWMIVLAANLISRKEIQSKQGKKLGGD